ncbi:hypothetical protein NQ176_g4347 [Zarea fungicola]|uniref:Uncharacterized protein n=1 Tax=Zarea fungicola TaxID=93591 RepID=A0ACC1NDU8_9HYPO|nr:hypothetical protein NQ176_g4347 [Lecanicillium fungicola]
MLASKLSHIICVIGLITGVNGKLDKPLIKPSIPPLDAALFKNLKTTQWTKSQWEWGWIPDRCRDVANAHKLNPYDIEVFNVQYTDCADIWIMCRHHEAEVSQDQMADIFGRLPVRMRDYVRLSIAFPGRGSRSAYTYSDLGDNIYFGDIQNHPTLWAHEIGHTLDINAVTKGQDFSASPRWIAAYNQDQAISDDYAQTNQAENFAQETVIALFDKVVPGGIGTVEPNWNAIFHQYATAQDALGDNIIPGGRCRNRFPNAGIVCMGPAAPCGKKRNAVAPFNVTLSDEVSEIPVIAGRDRKTPHSVVGAWTPSQ